MWPPAKQRKPHILVGQGLLKASVQARVRELQHMIAKMSLDQAAIDRAFVLRELRDSAITAKLNRQWSASNRALELLGKELGMFPGTQARLVRRLGRGCHETQLRSA